MYSLYKINAFLYELYINKTFLINSPLCVRTNIFYIHSVLSQEERSIKINKIKKFKVIDSIWTEFKKLFDDHKT